MKQFKVESTWVVELKPTFKQLERINNHLIACQEINKWLENYFKDKPRNLDYESGWKNLYQEYKNFLKEKNYLRNPDYSSSILFRSMRTLFLKYNYLYDDSYEDLSIEELKTKVHSPYDEITEGSFFYYQFGCTHPQEYDEYCRIHNKDQMPFRIRLSSESKFRYSRTTSSIMIPGLYWIKANILQEDYEGDGNVLVPNPDKVLCGVVRKGLNEKIELCILVNEDEDNFIPVEFKLSSNKDEKEEE